MTYIRTLKCHGNERGIILIVAMVGLAVSGLIVAAFVGLSVLDRREATNTRRMQQAFAAAEHGLAETIGEWDAPTWNLLAVNDSATVAGYTPYGAGSYSGTVRRVNNELFLINLLGHDAAAGVQQRVGAFVKLRTIEMDIQAALTAGGPIRIGGSAEIVGTDAAPLGWLDCDVDSSLAGIRLQDANDLETQGKCQDQSCIDGDPPVTADPTMNDSTFFQYGDLDWDALVAMASKVLVPGTYTGVSPSFTVDNRCDTGIVTNWGDPIIPTSACGGYFPIMYVPGSITVNGNYGQGILLVENNLSVQGGFEFYGVVIVRGALKTTGTGGHFTGSVFAANVDIAQNIVLGDALIQYSSCAADRVLTNASTSTLLRSRGWLQTY